MAIVGNSGFIYVDANPNGTITPLEGQDAEWAWNPTSEKLWRWDRVNDLWVEFGNNTIKYYDSGLGFYVMGTEGIVTTSSSAGIYNIDVPITAKLNFWYKSFDSANNATQLDGGGNFNIVTNWNQFNTSWADAILPDITSIINGQQYHVQATGDPSVTGVSMQHVIPSGGSYTTMFTNVAGANSGISMQFRGTF